MKNWTFFLNIFISPSLLQTVLTHLKVWDNRLISACEISRHTWEGRLCFSWVCFIHILVFPHTLLASALNCLKLSAGRSCASFFGPLLLSGLMQLNWVWRSSCSHMFFFKTDHKMFFFFSLDWGQNFVRPSPERFLVVCVWKSCFSVQLQQLMCQRVALDGQASSSFLVGSMFMTHHSFREWSPPTTWHRHLLLHSLDGDLSPHHYSPPSRPNYSNGNISSSRHTENKISH